MHATRACWLVPDARRRASSTLRAGHDVAGMGLPGHLDSLGPDSEVLARARSWPQRHGCTQAVLKFEVPVARRTGSDSRLRTACKLRLDTEVTECSEGGHSGPTAGTEIVIVAISRTCCRAAVPCEF